MHSITTATETPFPFLVTTIPSPDATTCANTLCKEVVQQSRIRHKEDFVIAFSPVVAEAAAVAYKGAPAEIQAKLRRVIDVWKDRAIFEAPIQAAIEARLSGQSLRASLGATSRY